MDEYEDEDEEDSGYGEPVRRYLRWSELRASYEGRLEVWADPEGEAEWMTATWAILERRGLSRYESATDEFDVRMRAVAMVWLYRSWCKAAFGEGEATMEDVARTLGAEPAWRRMRLEEALADHEEERRLTRGEGELHAAGDPTTEAPDDLAGDGSDDEDDADEPEFDERELYAYDAWCADVAWHGGRAYRAVARALRAAVGDDAELHLYLTLSRNPDFSGRFPIPLKARAEVLGGVSVEVAEMESYSWVSEGCPPMSDD